MHSLPCCLSQRHREADVVAVAGGVHVLLELVPESLPLLLSRHRGQCLDRHLQCPASGCQRARNDAPIAALAQQLLRDREAGGAADVAERGSLDRCALIGKPAHLKNYDVRKVDYSFRELLGN